MANVAKDSLPSSLLISREYPRSSSSISPVSSRQDSLRATHLGSGSEPPTPTSPPSRLTRKRATSLSIDAAVEPRLEDLALTSAGNLNNVSAGEKVCLCQPDPKIPRPRNGV
jgi:HMG box factor, other